VADDEGLAHPQRWHSTNLVGVPTPWLASTDFNRQAPELHIAGAREAQPGLFALLDRCANLNQATEVFVHYLHIAFGLRRPERHELGSLGASEQRRWRGSWRRLLQGWGIDANGPAAAVLKGWVESRFGLVPGFHKAPLKRFPSPEWITYLEEKTSSRHHSNNIHQQLDLLYEFCQWALRRFPLTPERHICLWRGSNRVEEQLVSGSLRSRYATVRLNNIVSFSLTPQDASCFGDWVFEVQVPLCKLLVFPGLLPGSMLQGEQEVVALGGDYNVVARYD